MNNNDLKKNNLFEQTKVGVKDNMNILKRMVEDYYIPKQEKEEKERIQNLKKWMGQIELTKIQQALEEVCGYDVKKYLGIIFEKEYTPILREPPEILKLYLQKERFSITEIKAYLATLYVFKACMNAHKLDSSSSSKNDQVETIYSLIELKVNKMFTPVDIITINSCQTNNELLDFVAHRFMTMPIPYGLNFQKEAKPIEIMNKEDMISIFINSLSSSWVIKFMFSQGFFGISILCLVQYALNAQRMRPPGLKWVIVIYGVAALIVAGGLFCSAMFGVGKDLLLIDKIKSNYLKFLPPCLSPELLKWAKEKLVAQYIDSEYEEIHKDKIYELNENERLLTFLFEMRKRLLNINPLLFDEDIFQLLLQGMRSKYSWEEFQAFLEQHIHRELVTKIDQLIPKRININKKVHELRKMIRQMLSTRLGESQIRQFIIEGVEISPDLDCFRTFLINKIEQMNLPKRGLLDRIANIFLFIE